MIMNKCGLAILFVFVIIASGCIQSTNQAISPAQPSLITFEKIVWTANQSIATKADVQALLDSHGSEIWVAGMSALGANSNTHAPLLEQAFIGQSTLPNQPWTVAIPTIAKGAEWRIGADGYIEEKSMECRGESGAGFAALYDKNGNCISNCPGQACPVALTAVWNDVGYVWLLIEQSDGTVKVIR